MELLVNNKNEIMSFSVQGSSNNNGLTPIIIDDAVMPLLFVELFKPRLFMLIENEIVVNQDFWLNSGINVPSEPSDEIDVATLKNMVSTLQKQSVETNKRMIALEAKVDDLEERVARLEEKEVPEYETGQ